MNLKDKRRAIFRCFLYNKELKFSEIEKKTSIRSNELAYYIQKLIDEQILIKNEESYSLTKEAEKYIPFFVDDNSLSPLPVVLVICKKGDKILLQFRKKRPYENHWSLISSRLRLGETIKEATKRSMKEKTFLDVSFISINSVIHEQNKMDNEVKNSFVFFLVLTEPLNEIKEKDDLKWFSIEELEQLKMIPSDRWLLLNKLDDRAEVVEEFILGERELSLHISPDSEILKEEEL
ncbi:MAG: NUDIX hydrolase [Candidatus Nanoarchaeia archaeon]